MTSTIRSVTGDVSASRSGYWDAHEHLLVGGGVIPLIEKELWLNDRQGTAEEMTRAHSAGLGVLVELTPCGLGRQPDEIRELSQLSGVIIIACTGLHLRHYYPADHWGWRYSASEIARLFIEDIEEGIDLFDYGGPIVRRTSTRAGVIKVAAMPGMSKEERRIYKAAAMAQRATGVALGDALL